MKVICEQLNPYSCKTYLIGLEGRAEVALVDPVIDHVGDYTALLAGRGLKLEAAIDTHTHADHISGAASLRDLLDCQYVMHERSPARCATTRVKDGDELNLFGQLPVAVMHTPGHTKDSISLMLSGMLFTGDALFLDDGGAGRDDLPGGDPAQHHATLQRFLALDENLVVHPAHDYRNRTPSPLSWQKRTNPHLKSRTRQEFVNYLEDLKLGPADWMKDVLKANYACARDPRAAWIPADAPACEVKGTIGAGANEVEVAVITVEQLRARLAAGERPVLIDVREKDELSGPLGHIEGIRHIPIGRLAADISALDDARGKEIVTVCRSGGRAHTAAQILAVAGFERVSVLDGGMLAWNG